MKTFEQSVEKSPNRQPLDSPDGISSPTRSRIKNVVFAGPTEIRSRRVVTRSRVRPTGKYPSWKMRRMLQWESVNELNAFRLLDCDPNVTGFAEQPCEIVYVDKGETKRHFPDLLVETKGCKELWEVKQESEALRPDISMRTELISKCLPEWGYAYRVALGHDLAKQPRLRNANLLLQFGRNPVTEREQEAIRLALKRQAALLWSDACNGAYGPNGREILCSLVLRGKLVFDRDSAWSPDTQFFPGKVGI